jgi:uncharacterized protein DUF6884
MRSICILSCSASKREFPTWAENLYASESFFLSRRYAEANFDAWAVLSAKHGLLLPGDIVSPYDRSINSLSQSERKALVDALRCRLTALNLASDSEFTSLCVPEYGELLEMAHIKPRQANFATLPKDERNSHLRAVVDPQASEKLLDSAYTIIQRVFDERGVVPLREALKGEVPAAGIYLFFDPKEPRLRDINQLRAVRVGTHGVASGSKASLRDRLRTHLGTASGGGNHRSSIFRLHVGRSLISAGRAKNVGSWGTNEYPNSDRLRRAEAFLEAEVSDYIGNLMVAVLEVPGPSSRDNDRAYLEQNLIALFSNRYLPLDPPSHRWLGRHSDKEEIRRSALWNVNHTGQNFDRRFLEMLDYYASLTLGRAPRSKPVTSPDWLSLVRADSRQLSLFS